MIGEIINIKADWADCEITIMFALPVGLLYCCSMLDEVQPPLLTQNTAKLYCEDGEPKWITTNEKRDFEIWINYAVNCTKVNSNVEVSFHQPIPKSSHTECIAIVKQLVDSNNIVCSIGELGENIPTVFAGKQDNLDIGDRIKFTGEVWIEVID